MEIEIRPTHTTNGERKVAFLNPYRAQCRRPRRLSRLRGEERLQRHVHLLAPPAGWDVALPGSPFGNPESLLMTLCQPPRLIRSLTPAPFLL